MVEAGSGGGASATAQAHPGTRLGLPDTDPSERFDRITLVAQRLLGVAGASINLVDDDWQRTKSTTGSSGAPIPRSISLCAVTVQQASMLVVPDTWADEPFRDNPLVTGGPRIRAYAGRPLFRPGGEPVGPCASRTSSRWTSPPRRSSS